MSDAVPRVSVVLPAYNAEATSAGPSTRCWPRPCRTSSSSSSTTAPRTAPARWSRRSTIPASGSCAARTAACRRRSTPASRRRARRSSPIQDADDFSVPDRLERQLAVLDERPEVAVVGSRMPEVDADGRQLTARAPFEPGDAYHVLMRFNPISNSSATFRRDVVVRARRLRPRATAARTSTTCGCGSPTTTSSSPLDEPRRDPDALRRRTSRPCASARASATRSMRAARDAPAAQPPGPAVTCCASSSSYAAAHASSSTPGAGGAGRRSRLRLRRAGGPAGAAGASALRCGGPRAAR